MSTGETLSLPVVVPDYLDEREQEIFVEKFRVFLSEGYTEQQSFTRALVGCYAAFPEHWQTATIQLS